MKTPTLNLSEFKKWARIHRIIHGHSKEASRDYLEQLGTHGKGGGLTVDYGGTSEPVEKREKPVWEDVYTIYVRNHITGKAEMTGYSSKSGFGRACTDLISDRPEDDDHPLFFLRSWIYEQDYYDTYFQKVVHIHNLTNGSSEKIHFIDYLAAAALKRYKKHSQTPEKIKAIRRLEKWLSETP